MDQRRVLATNSWRRKTIEVRVGYSNIRRLKVGNILLLNDRYPFTIRRIGSYFNFEELLQEEDPVRCAPDLTLEQLLPALRSHYPTEKEALGVIALEIVPKITEEAKGSIIRDKIQAL